MILTSDENQIKSFKELSVGSAFIFYLTETYSVRENNFLENEIIEDMLVFHQVYEKRLLFSISKTSHCCQ